MSRWLCVASVCAGSSASADVTFGVPVCRSEGSSRVFRGECIGVERAPLVFFESQRWRLYETGQASCLEEETVEEVRKLKGGRCRVW